MKNHAVDIVKGTLGAFLVAGLIAALQFLGSQIPELIQWLGSSAGGVAAIKAMRFRV